MTNWWVIYAELSYASIMDTIQKRGYVEVKKKVLIPTKSGRAVTKFLVEQPEININYYFMEINLMFF